VVGDSDDEFECNERDFEEIELPQLPSNTNLPPPTEPPETLQIPQKRRSTLSSPNISEDSFEREELQDSV
jgi:hypothetical protein